jgi:hypothetical protein
VLRRRSARVADSSQTAGFAVKIAVGGDLELVNRDTPLSGYSEDVVQLTCRQLALRPANSDQRRPNAALSPRCPSLALDNHTSLKIKWALTSTFAVELRGLEPLTSSMPSTVGLCGGPALRLAIGHPHPPLAATVRADW